MAFKNKQKPKQQYILYASFSALLLLWCWHWPLQFMRDLNLIFSVNPERKKMLVSTLLEIYFETIKFCSLFPPYITRFCLYNTSIGAWKIPAWYNMRRQGKYASILYLVFLSNKIPYERLRHGSTSDRSIPCLLNSKKMTLHSIFG